MANPRYKIVNASNDVFSAVVTHGEGLVQPNTRRVLELQEELSEGHIASFASSNIFIKKTNEAAQNSLPLPGLDENIAVARNRLMLAVGQERDDLIASLWDEALPKAKSAAKTSAAATTASPGSTPAAQGATATAAPAASAGNTSTAGS